MSTPSPMSPPGSGSRPPVPAARALGDGNGDVGDTREPGDPRASAAGEARALPALVVRCCCCCCCCLASARSRRFASRASHLARSASDHASRPLALADGVPPAVADGGACHSPPPSSSSSAARAGSIGERCGPLPGSEEEQGDVAPPPPPNRRDVRPPPAPPPAPPLPRARRPAPPLAASSSLRSLSPDAIASKMQPRCCDDGRPAACSLPLVTVPLSSPAASAGGAAVVVEALPTRGGGGGSSAEDAALESEPRGT